MGVDALLEYGVDLLKLVERTARSGEEKRGVLTRELEAAGIFDTNEDDGEDSERT